jgi:hypothetical protein
VSRTSDVQAGPSWLSIVIYSFHFHQEWMMAHKRLDYAFWDVESYKIAQLFHELSAKCGERLTAARQVARRHGVSAQRVLDLAAKFKPEPFWRL